MAVFHSFLLTLALSLAAPAAHAAAEKPNIVFILADDLGYGDLACYHPASKIPTPHLDRMAAQGMRFTDAHSPSSVCTPTRYALLTGRYAWRSPLKRGVLGPWNTPLIDPGRLTVPSLLRQHGYSTAMIGKWHLGLTYQTKDGKPVAPGPDHMSNVDFSKPIADGPTTRGFDSWFGINVPNYPPFCFIENDRTVGIPSVPMDGQAGGFCIPGPMLPGWKLVDILPELTRRAEKTIAASAASGKPFFLYLPLPSPHYPVVPTPDFQGKSKAGDYGDFVAQTDDCVGRVLAALDKAGVADNTLVIFTSDNGPETADEVTPGAYDRIRIHQHRSMGDLRGVKRDLWEGGHRVPFVARWPGKTPAGTVSDETVCLVDFMATVASLLGTKLPPDAGEDSFDLLPVLLGRKPAGPVREATVHHGVSGRLAIRKGDWVLIESGTGEDNRPAFGEPAWLKQERGYQTDQAKGQLYHLREDPAQKHNLYETKPELVRDLQALLDKYRNEGRSTPGPAQKDLPKVLLIGDSISIGYTKPVTKLLQGKADVRRIPGNGEHSGTGLKKLDQWLGDGRWDLIHFNWGLWDLCYRHPASKLQGNRDKVNGTLTTPLEVYEQNLDQLVHRLKKTGAKLVWAHTTTVPEGEPGRHPGDDARYNEVAARVMKRHGVPVNDLHALTQTFGPEMFTQPGDVHFTAQGYDRLARQVAATIEAALSATATPSNHP